MYLTLLIYTLIIGAHLKISYDWSFALSQARREPRPDARARELFFSRAEGGEIFLSKAVGNLTAIKRTGKGLRGVLVIPVTTWLLSPRR